MKHCAKCGKKKTLREFKKGRNICIDCNNQYDRFRQMAVDLDMTGAEFCRRAVIGEMDAREIED